MALHFSNVMGQMAKIREFLGPMPANVLIKGGDRPLLKVNEAIAVGRAVE